MDHWSSKRTEQTFSGHGRASAARVSRFNRPGPGSYYMPALLMLSVLAWLGAVGCGGAGASPAAAATPTATPSPSSAFTICSGQTYALCAVASCFVLDGVAYCKCDVKSEVGRQHQPYGRLRQWPEHLHGECPGSGKRLHGEYVQLT